MDEKTTPPANIDAYIALFPPAIAVKLTRLRQVIRQAAPQATEKISYQMPTFFEDGNLIHFAAAKNHIGLYPGSAPIVAFAKQLAPYHTSKGAIQFPLDQPIPERLVAEITAYCVARNKAQKAAKKG